MAPNTPTRARRAKASLVGCSAFHPVAVNHRLPGDVGSQFLIPAAFLLQLIDVIDGHSEGMVRFGADVLALSGDGQLRLIRTIDECVRRARKDRRPHPGMFSLAGAWSDLTVFIGQDP